MAGPFASSQRDLSWRAVALRACLLFLPQAALGGGILYLLFDLQSEGVLSVIGANQEATVALAAQRAAAELADVDSDLGYLAARPGIRNLLRAPTRARYADLAADLRVFVGRKAVYDQIRVLDPDGREILRVDWNDGNPRVAPKSQLQDKSDRPYVQAMLNRAVGDIHVSPFDLNVENGEVEPGIKPVVRFGTTIPDDSGRPAGMVVLNLLGRPLLDDMAGTTGPGVEQIWLLNQDGYWLLGPERDLEWRFMYPSRAQATFGDAYPQAWATIQGKPAGGQFMAPAGLFTYTAIGPGAARDAAAAVKPVAGLPAWTLVGFLPAATLDDLQHEQALEFIPAVAVLALLLAGLSFGVARGSVQRNQTESRIRAGEERFRAFVESAPDAVVIANTAGRIVLVNAQTERLFGHPRDRMIGQDIEMLVPAPLRIRHAGHRQDYLGAPRVREMGAGRDLNGLRADGTTFPVSISLSPVQTGEGMLVVADIRDVSDRLRAERQIQDLNRRLIRDNAELEAVNRELEAFSYSVSHDLRAPLRAIDGFSQALVEDFGAKLDGDGQLYLSRVRQGAQRMGLLIDDLLKLSRVTRQELVIEEVDLGAIAREILGRLQAEAPERNAEIAIQEGLQAQGDQRLLQIVLENLLGNAWKFTAGREVARIAFGEGDVGGGSAFCVSDNGAGFDMVYADQLFRAFQRLHTPSEFPGSGIGLATVQRIIHKHGGRVWAEATIDNGARFYFTLQ